VRTESLCVNTFFFFFFSFVGVSQGVKHTKRVNRWIVFKDLFLFVMKGVDDSILDVYPLDSFLMKLKLKKFSSDRDGSTHILLKKYVHLLTSTFLILCYQDWNNRSATISTFGKNSFWDPIICRRRQWVDFERLVQRIGRWMYEYRNSQGFWHSTGISHS